MTCPQIKALVPPKVLIFSLFVFCLQYWELSLQEASCLAFSAVDWCFDDGYWSKPNSCLDYHLIGLLQLSFYGRVKVNRMLHVVNRQ